MLEVEPGRGPMVAPMTMIELEMMVNQAAERGATAALAKIGMHDAEAGADLGEIRRLLAVYRSAKTGAVAALGRAIMSLLVAGIIIIAAMLVSRGSTIFPGLK